MVIDSNREERLRIVEAIESRYQVKDFGDVGEAVICLRGKRPTALVADDRVRVPSRDGLVAVLRYFFKGVPVVLCTTPGHPVGDVDARLDKPFLRSHLINILSGVTNRGTETQWASLDEPHPTTLRNSIETFNHIAELMEVGEPLAYDYVIAACTPLVKAVIDSSYKALISAVRTHDNVTYVHSLRVATLLSLFGHTIGLKDDAMLILATGGLLHDVGKMAMADELINKPRKLTDEEMKSVQRHVTASIEYLRNYSDVPKGVLTIAAQHHERLDGSGYPNGLKGSQLNDLARMSAIVDVFTALTERRSYRPATSPEKVFTLMRDEMKKSLDQRLLEQFREMLLDASSDGWSVEHPRP